MEQDSSSMEKRFAYKFLKKLLKYVDCAQEYIAHLGKKPSFLHLCILYLLKYYKSLENDQSIDLNVISIFQKLWLAVERMTGHLMSGKSSFLPRLEE